MVSPHQAGTRSGGYDSEAKKYLATKNDLTLAALIAGMRDVDRVDEWIHTEVELADEEDRDARQALIGDLNRKKAELSERGG